MANSQASGDSGSAGTLVALGVLGGVAAFGGGKIGQALSSETNANGASSLSQQTLTRAEASRFLAQAANGGTSDQIDSLVTTGIGSWLQSQFATPRPYTNWDCLVEKGYNDASHMYNIGSWQVPLWKGLLTGPDLLRQRVVMSLAEIFPININQISAYWRSFSQANFFDILANNCFGNFRNLIEDITYSTAMGDYLTYVGSQKPSGSRRPDENYAREIMQLFTIGLHQLGDDGSILRSASGAPIPTYTQADVEQLSLAFTGMVPASSDFRDYSRHKRRLVFNSNFNYRGKIDFLGHRVQGGADVAVSKALDILFYHPNVGPFIGRRLIQSLITSNPSGAYVQRVAAAFANNGSGVRGDMKAVITAILTDPEARAQPMPYAGRLRSPIERFINWARAFHVKDPIDRWLMPNFLESLAQSPGLSPSVFGFYRPNYSPPQTGIREQGLFAPEFQIVDEQTSIAYINFIAGAVAGWLAFFNLKGSYTEQMPLAMEPARLVEELNIVLAAGQLSLNTKSVIESAVSTIFATEANRERRVMLAALMVLTSPEYLILE